MHAFMLFLLIPGLNRLVRILLGLGHINYLSTDNLPAIFSTHPFISLGLIGVLLLILFMVFFEFTFLLISMYFIVKRQPIGVKQLLQMTVIQIEKIRLSSCIFFLFYFFLILPIGGLGFNSDLLAKIKVPAFIMDFIFTNRWVVVPLVLLAYLMLIYLGIRFIFALPEMILRDTHFRQAIKDSWQLTRRKFFPILGRFLFIGGAIFLGSSASTFLILFLQRQMEQHLAQYALPSAVIAMTLLQVIMLLNLVLSTVGIFFIIIDYMKDEGFLPELPTWFYREKVVEKKETTTTKLTLAVLFSIIVGIGVGAYNLNYLTTPVLNVPMTVSHRGVSENNGVQNTLASLEKTAALKPDYIEMDVQETKDHQFIVYHDFNLKELTGIDRSPSELTLAELEKLTISENGYTENLSSFDDYLEAANRLDQHLLIEIKTQKTSVHSLVNRFLDKYQTNILRHGHLIHSLNYNVVEAVKARMPEQQVGYILPFNVVGPPKTSADFLTMEYSTINRSFIDAAHKDGKKVLVWTVNDTDSMTRMMFYGADGIITDDMPLLSKAVTAEKGPISYSEQLLHFTIGIG